MSLLPSSQANISQDQESEGPEAPTQARPQDVEAETGSGEVYDLRSEPGANEQTCTCGNVAWIHRPRREEDRKVQ